MQAIAICILVLILLISFFLEIIYIALICEINLDTEGELIPFSFWFFYKYYRFNPDRWCWGDLIIYYYSPKSHCDYQFYFRMYFEYFLFRLFTRHKIVNKRRKIKEEIKREEGCIK